LNISPGAPIKESGSIPEHEDKTYDDRKEGYNIVGKVNSWVFVVKIRDNQGEYCDRQNRTGYWPYNLKRGQQPYKFPMVEYTYTTL